MSTLLLAGADERERGYRRSCSGIPTYESGLFHIVTYNLTANVSLITVKIRTFAEYFNQEYKLC